MQVQSFPPDALVFRQGAVATFFYVLFEGRVAMHQARLSLVTRHS